MEDMFTVTTSRDIPQYFSQQIQRWLHFDILLSHLIWTVTDKEHVTFILIMQNNVKLYLSSLKLKEKLMHNSAVAFTKNIHWKKTLTLTDTGILWSNCLQNNH